MSLGKYACIDCDSSDAMELYQDDDGTYNATCFAACRIEDGKGFKSHNRLADSYLKDELGIEKISYKKSAGSITVKPKVIKKVKKEADPISVNEIKRIIANTSVDAKNFRGIRKETLERYRVRTAFCEETGAVSEVYYPITKGEDEKGKARLVGYHKRIVIPEKSFRAVGLNSKSCELFGQHLCKGTGKLVICGGQHDVLAASQMFEDYRKKRIKAGASIAPVDFVSSTVGESSVASQIRENYSFVDGYAEIILDMDSDLAGESAIEAIMEVLPFHKTKIMRYNAKDANDALEEGISSEYIKAIYEARRPTVSGIVSSLDLHEKILDTCKVEAIPLPPILRQANEMLSGGLPLGEIVNILAGSGVGKTTVIGEMVYYWVFNSPHKVGVLSYEAIAGQYGTKILSRHLGKNILKIVDRDEDGNVLSTKNNRMEFLQQDWVLEKAQELYMDDNGDERFALIDDRDEITTVEGVKKKILQLIKANQVKVVLIDPVSDLLSSLELSEQAAFCSWLKKMKSTGVTFILVNHSRKGSSGIKSASRGADLDEQDILGTGDLFRSGAVNIILSRDKEAEDEDMKHTTTVRITKNRDGSETGKAGELYYEYKEAKLYDKKEYMMKRGVDF